jgi:hypothetical protein
MERPREFWLPACMHAIANCCVRRAAQIRLARISCRRQRAHCLRAHHVSRIKFHPYVRRSRKEIINSSYAGERHPQLRATTALRCTPSVAAGPGIRYRTSKIMHLFPDTALDADRPAESFRLGCPTESDNRARCILHAPERTYKGATNNSTVPAERRWEQPAVFAPGRQGKPSRTMPGGRLPLFLIGQHRFRKRRPTDGSAVCQGFCCHARLTRLSFQVLRLTPGSLSALSTSSRSHGRTERAEIFARTRLQLLKGSLFWLGHLQRVNRWRKLSVLFCLNQNPNRISVVVWPVWLRHAATRRILSNAGHFDQF